MRKISEKIKTVTPKEMRKGLEDELEEKIREGNLEIIASPSSPEQKERELKEKAKILEQRMEQEHFLLTGEREKLNVEDLYRDMLRQMMVNVGLLKRETHEALKEEYKKKGSVEPLFEIMEEAKMNPDKAKKALRNISGEAQEFEEMAVFFIKSYAEGGHITPQLFLNQLANYLSDQSVARKRFEMGLLQKDLKEFTQADDKSSKKNKDHGVETFEKMNAQKKNRYVAKKANATKDERMSIHQLWESFKNDPVISNDLRGMMREYQKFYVEAAELAALQPEKTIRQADILGLNY